MESFKPQHDDKEFERGKFLLQSLGLSVRSPMHFDTYGHCVCAQKYDRNLKKGQLTDNTIMLWTDR